MKAKRRAEAGQKSTGVEEEEMAVRMVDVVRGEGVGQGERRRRPREGESLDSGPGRRACARRFVSRSFGLKSTRHSQECVCDASEDASLHAGGTAGAGRGRAGALF